MRNPAIVTTSWDDGDISDLKIAELLQSRGVRGTFYVPIHGYNGSRRIEDRDLKVLDSAGFEIGAHGVSHKSLSTLSQSELVREVRNCKDSLEQLLGRDISMFCYPNGRYNSTVIRRVREAGYQGARTTRMLASSCKFRPFEIPTTVQAYPHRILAYLRNQARAKSALGLMTCLTDIPRARSWIDLGKQLFAHVLRHGGIWHLYGHSWEVNQLQMWGDLRNMLDYVSHRKGVIYATNGQMNAL